MTAGEPENEVEAGIDAEVDTGEPDDSPETAEVDELAQLQRESDENHDRYLRLAAELENMRKRHAREVDNARKFGIERFAQALLPVYDSLEASLSIEQTDVEALLEGQRAILRLLDEAFASAGVEQIDPHGHPFDPAKHEAMSMLPSADVEPHSIIEVIQKGYSIQERILRPARVVVAQPPAEDDDQPESPEDRDEDSAD